MSGQDLEQEIGLTHSVNLHLLILSTNHKWAVRAGQDQGVTEEVSFR